MNLKSETMLDNLSRTDRDCDIQMEHLITAMASIRERTLLPFTINLG